MATGPAEVSLPERILDVAEDVLRRHGPEKTNVIDIARVLGMSHANIYRHFSSKKALLNAVAARWLNAMEAPLAVIAADAARPPVERLTAWLEHLRAAKRRKLRDDPELFRMHRYITDNEKEMVAAHVAALRGQIERIIAAGMASGTFRRDLEPATAARAVLHATSALHHPALVMQDPPASEADARAVMDLVVAALRAN